MYDHFEHRADDSLATAFSEFRAAVDQLIDEQIAHLNEGTDEAEPRAAVPPAAAADAGTERQMAGAHGSSASPAISRVTIRAASGDRRLHAVSSAKRPAKPGGQAPSKPDVVERDDDDPRQRLDALARHLDNRLRRARDAGTDRAKPPAEG
jgi:hypothetical protein